MKTRDQRPGTRDFWRARPRVWLRDAQRERGFALLLTLTMLAFAVILIVGLASYARIETAIAGNVQQQAQARENALLALNVALGRLQEHAGPDTRVTATAASVPNVQAQKRHYTGVWDATATGPDALAWLASGKPTTTTTDTPDGPVTTTAFDLTAAIPADRRVTMLGSKSDGSSAANEVAVELEDIAAPGVPGATGNATTIGRYAWWVGDQGVKAPVAVPDTSGAIDYAPFADGAATDLRARIRQQIGLGAGAAVAATGEPAFEVRDDNTNKDLVAGDKIVATNQLAFLRNASNTPIGLTTLRANYHAWSPNNHAVLADTKRGGLRQDLSLDPGLLGSAFAAWANYYPLRGGYMEKLKADAVEPAAGGSGPAEPAEPSEPAFPPAPDPTILPSYSADPLRRRYRITPPEPAAGAIHGVAPVMSFFGISFSIRESAANAPLMEIAARCVIGLWNPYTSALIPEALKVEVRGLPAVQVDDSAGGEHPLDLQRWIAGGADQPLTFSLPWPDEAEPNSWLPGRVYNWSATENFTEPTGGNLMVAHAPDAIPTENGGAGIVRQTDVHHHEPPPASGGTVTRSIRATRDTVLRVTVRRASDDMELATYLLPVTAFGPTTPIKVDNKFIDFAIVRRLPQGDELPLNAGERWLEAPGRDPRAPLFSDAGFIAGPEGEDPGAYGGDNRTHFAVRDAQRLLDRAGDAKSYNEDVPLFELPRAPILSLGMLQHLQLDGARPFTIGNPWAGQIRLNDIPVVELFDRFFFSGLVPGVVPTVSATGNPILPNPLLKLLRKPDGPRPGVDEIRATADDVTPPPPTTDENGNPIDPGTVVVAPIPGQARSSKYLLQAGAFNLNSTEPAAWAAVLRSVRFPTSASAFTYLDANPATGTAADVAALPYQSGEAHFLRFPQSAQETYKAENGMGDSNAPGASTARTELFRRGLRTLTAAQVSALAAKIVEFVRAKHASADAALGGPFRSLEEFLSPSALFAGIDADGNVGAPRSVLEAAIADAQPADSRKINVDENGAPLEFSSQFLTQADIMTALAPVLFPRSDTFVIRTYGEAVNPAKLGADGSVPANAVEGRAWCEAIVQRVPEYFDPSVAADTLPGEFDDEANEAEALNKRFGRRFKVISFRWLTRSDI